MYECKKTIFVLACLISTLFSSCTLGAYIPFPSPSQLSTGSLPLPYTYIPIHCETSKIPETLKVIEQISSGAVIEINTQNDCKNGYFILEVPMSIREAITKESYKMVILSDDSSQGPRTSFTADEWQWLKNLNTQLIINREVEITFPGVSRTVDQRDLFEILPILSTGTPKKYTNLIEYAKDFPNSLTREDIQKCDTFVPGSLSYSGMQVFYTPPREDDHPKEMQGFKDRATCYAQVIR